MRRAFCQPAGSEKAGVIPTPIWHWQIDKLNHARFLPPFQDCVSEARRREGAPPRPPLDDRPLLEREGNYREASITLAFSSTSDPHSTHRREQEQNPISANNAAASWPWRWRKVTSALIGCGRAVTPLGDTIVALTRAASRTR